MKHREMEVGLKTGDAECVALNLTRASHTGVIHWMSALDGQDQWALPPVTRC